MGTVFEVARIIFITAVSIGGVLLSSRFVYMIFAFLPKQKMKETDKKAKYAILIPARNESLVIEDLLKSIKAQDYPKDFVDTYVIVERSDDPTIEIATRYGAIPFVRAHLERKGKGHALNELISSFYEKGMTYDAFIIQDADNLLKSDFISELNKAYFMDYDIAVGYRHNKNCNDGAIATCSGLTFSTINTAQNKARSYLGFSLLLSGTGFFIARRVLDTFRGWPFTELTEDYELSVYSSINNLKMRYVESAEFYDEQPVDMRTSVNQRVRWVKGFQNVRKKYSADLWKSVKTGENFWSKIDLGLGVLPMIILVVSCIVYAVFLCVCSIVYACLQKAVPLNYIFEFLWFLLGIYVFMLIYSLTVVLSEGGFPNMTMKSKLIAIFFYPIFLSTYLPIGIKALLSRSVEWKAIEHGKDKKS